MGAAAIRGQAMHDKFMADATDAILGKKKKKKAKAKAAPPPPQPRPAAAPWYKHPGVIAGGALVVGVIAGRLSKRGTR